MSKLLDGLNPAQREAVAHKLGPLLIIAGPGSGKTRTVVHSIAYAIENGVLPEQILAFSFTIKASGELRGRVKEIVGEEKGDRVNISTFHRFCRGVLREDIEKLQEGYTRDFKSLSENDQKRMITNLTRSYEQMARTQIEQLQSHEFPKTDEIINFIKKCKAMDIRPSEADPYVPELNLPKDYIKIYEMYEEKLRSEGCIDYESQQILTSELFSKVPEIKVKWQDKFELIFVDEYQDTDPVQYRIINALSEKSQNLRVVGDDDQGIYGFRGADIQNILNFEQDYPNAKVISLGQNYRSTQEIVAVTSALVDFNPERRQKELFTRNFEGEKVKYFHCQNHEIEAKIICSFIHRAISEGCQQPNDFAVLYRTRKQAQVFKKTLSDLGIQYNIVQDSSDRDMNGVSLMTIHKSKGLEFPNVFVTGICEDLLPFYYSRDEKDWPEELRLLYVAMTRAKNWLCLSSYKKDSSFDRGPSPFLERGYIPINLIESLETLENTPMPPIPKGRSTRVDTEATSEYIEPIPEKLLGDGMTVIGVDPGNIGTRNTNVGWSITQKTSAGYSVLDFGTESPLGTQENKRRQIEQKIRSLIQSSPSRPHAIAIEKLEVATKEETKEWFLYVAACVATVRNIANEQDIECRLYTPQHVKDAATGKRDASKREVQNAVKRMCNLPQIPEPHHSADAIATSLCYLRSYLNSSRFEGNKRKMERYNTGCDYIEKRQFDAANDEFKETLYIDPIYTDAYVSIGRVHLSLNDLEAAENAAKKALKLTDNNHPDSQQILNSIGQYRSGCSSLDNSEWNIAIDKFQESVNFEPIFTEAHCGLSKANLEIGNLEDAKNAADEALNLRTDYPPARELLKNIKMKSYDKGKTYFNREEYDKAIIELQRAVTIDQEFKGAYLYLGKTYLKLGDLEAAEKEAREALRVDSTYELARHVMIPSASNWLGLRVDPTYELASKLLSEIKEKHKEQGDDYRQKESYVEAVKSYQQAIRIDDKYRDAYNSLGITYYKMKDYSKAINSYQQAINISESSHVVHTNLSIVYLDISVYVKAVKSLKRAIAIKPDYQIAYYYLARAYFKMENLPDASKTGLEAKRLEPNDQRTLKLIMNIQDSYLNRGHDYFKQDNFAAAEKETRAALQLDQNYESANRLLTSIKEKYVKLGLKSLKQNEYKEAVKFAKEALRIDENYKPASELLRRAYYEQGVDHIEKGRYDKAINILQKANDIDPNCECEKTHYYLGKAYYKLGSLKKAQLSVKEALDIQLNYPQASELLSDINHPRNWLRLGVANVRHFTRRILRLNQD